MPLSHRWTPSKEFELSEEQIQLWQRDGWILIDSLFPPEVVTKVELHVAQAGFPLQREFEPPLAKSQFDMMTTFPFSSVEANNIATSATVASISRALLEHEAIQLYQAQLWLKRAGEAAYEQTHHRDYAKNTMLTPRNELGLCDFLSFIVYLTDVNAESGPTAFVSRALTIGRPLEPARFTPENDADMYRSEVLACAAKGSALFYAGDTFHRATELRNDSSRLVTKGAVKRIDATWVGYVHGLRVGFEPDWSRFVSGASSTQLRFLMGHVTPSRLEAARTDRYRSKKVDTK
jgi:Phytanoyl-CoA dioxygenase (PhyH)